MTMIMDIRAYKEKDRENCRDICHKTATAPKYVKSKELVCLLYCDYYIDNEPDNCFVLADEEDNAIGYILSAEDDWAYGKAMKAYLKKAGRISFSEKIMHHIASLMEKSVAKRYPAHLHIDILPEGQRMGYGTKLIEALEAHLRGKGVKGVRLGVGGDNTGAHSFYEANGYTLLKNYKSFGRVYGKKLASDE
ncbi:MAG: GNAT family N-acetyltransferase [Clostridia bacterium]|nr:GNAT family N-acetyltransferase [Clostridia bacterium]